MKPISDDELRLALSGLRLEPRPEFAAQLDARVAAGFPRRSRLARVSPGAAAARLRALRPRWVLIPAGGIAVAAIVAVAVVLSQGSSTELNTVEALQATSGGAAAEPRPEQSLIPAESVTGTNNLFDAAGAYQSPGPQNLTSKRAIERDAQLTLGTEPENVSRASSEVFDIVHANRGIVLRSQTSDGSAAHPEAQFELQIPSGKLGDAMASFSRVGEVRSRHESTADITAPTVSTAARLEDSRARIDSLLGQLAAAESEGEREAVEGELRSERNRAAALQVGLDRLEQRANLSRVSLRIVGGEGPVAAGEGGDWGIGQALEDAGSLLGVAAAVTLLVLAVVAPLALIALLAWIARRAYLRRARRTALS